jgi:hypothetical protein
MSKALVDNVYGNEGVLLSAATITIDTQTWTGTYVREQPPGFIVDGPRPLTDEEWVLYGPRPLDATGALATLLAVESVLTVQDAANAVGLTPQDLINEAEAWAVGS